MNIRKLFFTYRNGVVADALKRAGDPHSLIFGLQLPQLSQIAREVKSEMTEEDSEAIAGSLWEERDCRESRLLATYLFNPAKLSRENAEALLDECRTPEETDMLVFRCLRNHPEAPAIRDARTGTYDAEAFSRFI